MTNPLTVSLLVGLGGFVESVLRYALSVASQRYTIEWPVGTLAANIIGCLVPANISTLQSTQPGRFCCLWLRSLLEFLRYVFLPGLEVDCGVEI